MHQLLMGPNKRCSMGQRAKIRVSTTVAPKREQPGARLYHLRCNCSRSWPTTIRPGPGGTAGMPSAPSRHCGLKEGLARWPSRSWEGRRPATELAFCTEVENGGSPGSALTFPQWNPLGRFVWYWSHVGSSSGGFHWHFRSEQCVDQWC